MNWRPGYNGGMNKCLAAIVSISLIISAPGAQAWGQVASAIRPVPVGVGLLAAAGSISPTFGSQATLPPSLSAPSLSTLNLSPVPAALSIAALPAAAVPVMVIAAATPPRSKPAALAATLTAASARLATAPEAAGKNEVSLNQLSALFDGRAALSAAFAPEGPNPEKAPSLNTPAKRPAHKPFIPATRVTDTLAAHTRVLRARAGQTNKL